MGQNTEISSFLGYAHYRLDREAEKNAFYEDSRALVERAIQSGLIQRPEKSRKKRGAQSTPAVELHYDCTIHYATGKKGS